MIPVALRHTSNFGAGIKIVSDTGFTGTIAAALLTARIPNHRIS